MLRRALLVWLIVGLATEPECAFALAQEQGTPVSGPYAGKQAAPLRPSTAEKCVKYCYDSQDRPLMTHYANGTHRDTIWNRVNTIACTVDPRRCAKVYAYDAKKRRTGMTVENAPAGVGQTTMATWQYDGLDRNTLASDDDSTVFTTYDSLGQELGETEVVDTASGSPVQFTSSCVNDGVGNRVGITYPAPSTGTPATVLTLVGTPALQLTQKFDQVNRLKEIDDASATPPIATYAHMGMGSRRLSRDYYDPSDPTGKTKLVHLACTYDGDRREIEHMHFNVVTGKPIKDFQYAWDRAGNRRYENEVWGGLGDYYKYDSEYRLATDVNGLPSSVLTGLGNVNDEVSFNDPSFAAGTETDYNLDGANNRTSTTTTSGGSSVTTGYGLSALTTFNPPAGTSALPLPTDILSDAAMNQYSSIGGLSLTHDFDGNETQGPNGDQRFYDCYDQLVQITNGSSGTDTRYRYDVLGRRISKYSATNSFPETVFVKFGQQTLEEWTPGNTAATNAGSQNDGTPVSQNLSPPRSLPRGGRQSLPYAPSFCPVLSRGLSRFR